MAGAGVTQAQLGAHLGLSQMAVSRRCSGRVEWSAAEVLAIADVLHVDVADLLPTQRSA